MTFPHVKPKTWLVLLGLSGFAVLACTGWRVSNWGRLSPNEMRQECQRVLQLRRWDRLQELGTRWTTDDPQSGEAWIFLAEAFNGREDFQKAMECLTRVPDSSPQAEVALTAQMNLQFGPLNRPRDGAVTAARIIQLNPQSNVAQQRLIFFLTMTLQRDRLNKQIRLALETGTEPPEAYVYLFFLDSLFFANGAELNGHWLLGEPDSELFEVGEAVFIAETLDASVSMDDRETAQAAQRAQSRKDSVLKELLQKYPHNSELLAYQLRECILTGNVPQAVELLAQATVAAEQDNRFWRFKGWIHANRNEPSAAESAYRQALKLHPLDSGTRHALAELLQRQQRSKEVEQLRSLVSRANEIRRAIHRAPSARQIPRDVLMQLADYAKDCGDNQVASVLKKRIQQFSRNAQVRSETHNAHTD